MLSHWQTGVQRRFFPLLAEEKANAQPGLTRELTSKEELQRFCHEPYGESLDRRACGILAHAV